MKKLISSVLVLVILLSFAIPAMAANDLQTMRASLLLDGGLKYEESTGRYILYGRATGIVENKTVTAKLYRQRGDSWTFIDSVTNTDTAETVKAQKYVTVVENNDKVQ